MGFVLPVIVAVIGVWIAFSIVVWATGRDTLLDIAPAGAPLGLGDGEAVDETAVASVKFDTGLRGYRTDQVDAALYRLAWEIGRKDEQIAVLQAQVGGGQDEPAGIDAEPLFDEDTFRPAEDSDGDGDRFADPEAAVATEGERAESEARREDDGEKTPRGDA
ncbi:MAG TPA: DivIVA domain-containing protein [Glycomyces sp.]|nr:DivIVA domain-containing protein [Glycomyces sp.]